ncbi:MAG: DUF554 domain-containing protein [Armatimonadetes bacterium]|nr:DUF554 domain-containing protein [Armatimonadota bacterium]
MKKATLPGRGTILNTITVIVGSLIGLAIGNALPSDAQTLVQNSFGFITMLIGVSMFLKGKNVLITLTAIAVGGILGMVLGISAGLDWIADQLKTFAQGESRFNEGLITATILYCVGPMTLLGCLQDALERKIELLSIKSMLDGITSIFFAATMGVGVLFSAIIVLVFQGLLTLLAGLLRPMAKKPEYLDEISAVGGVMMVSIGLGLAGIKDFPTEQLLPALFIAPALVWVISKFVKKDAIQEPASVE